MDNRYGKAFVALLLAVVCISGVCAAPCPICSKWEGQEFHDAQVTKGGRCKTGTIPRGCVPSMNKSEDYCLRCQSTVRYNTPSGYRRCPKCFGKGEIPDKIEDPKEDAKTTSKDASPVQKDNGKKPSGDQPVVLVGVKKCDKCDEKGKIATTNDCDLCENGFSHKKDGDSYKCRACGKICTSRFDPCCKPDCSKCGNTREVKMDCPLCGGDKVITPLEEARNKERMTPVATKQ